MPNVLRFYFNRIINWFRWYFIYLSYLTWKNSTSNRESLWVLLRILHYVKLTLLFSNLLTICLNRTAKAQLISIINKSVKFQANVVSMLQIWKRWNCLNLHYNLTYRFTSTKTAFQVEYSIRANIWGNAIPKYISVGKSSPCSHSSIAVIEFMTNNRCSPRSSIRRILNERYPFSGKLT